MDRLKKIASSERLFESQMSKFILKNQCYFHLHENFSPGDDGSYEGFDLTPSDTQEDGSPLPCNCGVSYLLVLQFLQTIIKSKKNLDVNVFFRKIHGIRLFLLVVMLRACTREM